MLDKARHKRKKMDSILYIKKSYILPMIFKGHLALFLAFMLWSCGFEGGNDGNSLYRATHCSANTDLPLGRSPLAWSLNDAGNTAYILDDFAGISRWDLHFNDCNWELDRSWGQDGVVHSMGFADEIRLGNGEIWLRNGSVVQNLEGSAFCSGVQGESFAIWGSKLVAASSLGAQIYDITATSCRGGAYVGNMQTAAVGANANRIILAEKPLLDGSLTIWSYDWQGNAEWFYAQNATGALCGIDKIAMGREVALLLDLQCHQVGVLGYHGDMLGVLSLREYGVPRRIKDIAPGLNVGDFWLLAAGQPLTYRVSYRYLLGNI